MPSLRPVAFAMQSLNYVIGRTICVVAPIHAGGWLLSQPKALGACSLGMPNRFNIQIEPLPNGVLAAIILAPALPPPPRQDADRAQCQQSHRPRLRHA